MEFLAIYDCKFGYVKDEDNTVADALSRYLSASVTSTCKAEQNSSHPYNDSKLKHLILLENLHI
ncbi:hypothetical protein BJ165DRAFT_1358891 [Panaeolus papilionaceus]|nr:hypothetical protein BJ165DRAFT_1358891 [Panaeolus papilionaceus]